MFQVKARPGPFPITGKNAHKVWWKWGREWVTQSHSAMFQNIPTSKFLYNIQYIPQSVRFLVVPLLTIFQTRYSIDFIVRRWGNSTSYTHCGSILISSSCYHARPAGHHHPSPELLQQPLQLSPCACAPTPGSLLQIQSQITFQKGKNPPPLLV